MNQYAYIYWTYLTASDKMNFILECVFIYLVKVVCFPWIATVHTPHPTVHTPDHHIPDPNTTQIPTPQIHTLETLNTVIMTYTRFSLLNSPRHETTIHNI